MVNNESVLRGLARDLSITKLRQSLTFTLLFLLLPNNIDAQPITNRYRSHLNSDGITYFFCPKKIGHNANVSKFTYDMTYHTSEDSVTLNFTIITTSPVKVEGFELTYEQGNCTGSNVATMYADIVGSKYEIRTTSRFSLKDIYEAFSQEEGLCFRIHFEDDGEGSASYGSSEWKKESKAITRIIDLINFQK